MGFDDESNTGMLTHDDKIQYLDGGHAESPRAIADGQLAAGPVCKCGIHSARRLSGTDCRGRFGRVDRQSA